MAVKTLAQLKERFETGDTPTGQDFIDFLDSFLHGQLGNFPDPLPAVSGKNLLDIGEALPDPLPARSGENLTNINPGEYNVPGNMPIPSYATANTFVLTGDFTSGATDPADRIFLIGRRTRIQIGGAYEYTEVANAVFGAGITTVTTLDNMSGSPIEEVAVGVITPAASGGAVTGGIIGVPKINEKVFTTGDVKLTLKTVADTGWVLMDDKTIGNAASGATGRANADTVDLYTLLWNNTADADCAVSSGRGASAAADYAANKTIALPKTLGRALACYGAGSGLTSRALAKIVGTETHILTEAEIPAHTHSTIAESANQDDIAGGASGVYNGAGVTGSTGGGSAHNNMQPSVFLNVMIKL
jgi:hypothetical protein